MRQRLPRERPQFIAQPTLLGRLDAFATLPVVVGRRETDLVSA